MAESEPRIIDYGFSLEIGEDAYLVPTSTLEAVREALEEAINTYTGKEPGFRNAFDCRVRMHEALALLETEERDG